MGFENVDDQERHAALILIVEAVEGGNLPPEGWSGVAAEDQDDWLLGSERRELDALGFVELHQREIGSGITVTQSAGAGMGPHGFKWGEQKGRWGGHARHDAAEGFRRLVHGPPDKADEGEVGGEECGEDAEQNSTRRFHGQRVLE